MTTLIVEVGGASYLAAPFTSTDSDDLRQIFAIESVHAQGNPYVRPCTVISAGERCTVSATRLQSLVEDMLWSDDVLISDFLSCLVFSMFDGMALPLADDMATLLSSWGCNAAYTPTSSKRIQPGPYFLSQAGLHPAYKLYEDSQLAFVCGIVPTDDKGERFIEIASALIPVPSRLLHGPSTLEKPLSGKRVGIKDLFDISGVATTAGSRAYAKLHRKADSTAGAVRKLIELGAAVVGKTRTAQFAAGAEPNYWVDYQCPFNPRGDGYESTSGSSVGSAVAVAAYDWLDFAIASDTLGSVPWPASAQGVYGMRPSLECLPRDGLLVVSQLLDVVGYFGRDLSELHTFGEAWYAQGCVDTIQLGSLKILWPAASFQQLSEPKRTAMKEFVADMENITGVKKLDFDMEEIWNEHCPLPNYEPLHKYMNTTLAHIQLYEAYHNTRCFRDEYYEKFGHTPYADPTIGYKWSLGAKITGAEYEQACQERMIFRKFIKEHLFHENAILLHPGGVYSFATEGLLLRDEYLGKPEEVASRIQGFGFKNTFASFLGGSPFLMVPLGQCPGYSRATRQMVQEPISIGLIGPPGSDIGLMRMVLDVLAKSGRRVEVHTGKTAF